jgi:hypothetical protein
VESGTASVCPLPESCCFIFVGKYRVILLVFVLVSAAIDDESDIKFKWLWY